MILLEHELEGMMRRKINYGTRDETGERTLDYSNMLNEKENQIVEL